MISRYNPCHSIPYRVYSPTDHSHRGGAADVSHCPHRLYVTKKTTFSLFVKVKLLFYLQFKLVVLYLDSLLVVQFFAAFFYYFYSESATYPANLPSHLRSPPVYPASN